MKNLMPLLGLMLLVSCSKTWKCDRTVTYDTESFDDVYVVSESDFNGTKKEMQEHEWTDVTKNSTGTITQELKCY
jgi:hypothetical protein